MGNPNRLPEEHPETYEGRVIDPRLESNRDPHLDPRYDTHLNAGAVPPKNLGAGLRALAIVLGLVMFALLIALMYWHFQTPSPRSPEGQQSRVEPVVMTALPAFRA